MSSGFSRITSALNNLVPRSRRPESEFIENTLQQSQKEAAKTLAKTNPFDKGDLQQHQEAAKILANTNRFDDLANDIRVQQNRRNPTPGFSYQVHILAMLRHLQEQEVDKVELVHMEASFFNSKAGEHIIAQAFKSNPSKTPRREIDFFGHHTISESNQQTIFKGITETTAGKVSVRFKNLSAPKLWEAVEKSSKDLKYLNVSDNGLPAPPQSALERTKLEHLDISDNEFALSPHEAAAIGEALAKNTSLKSINLARTSEYLPYMTFILNDKKGIMHIVNNYTTDYNKYFYRAYAYERGWMTF